MSRFSFSSFFASEPPKKGKGRKKTSATSTGGKGKKSTARKKAGGSGTQVSLTRVPPILTAFIAGSLMTLLFVIGLTQEKFTDKVTPPAAVSQKVTRPQQADAKKVIPPLSRKVQVSQNKAGSDSAALQAGQPVIPLAPGHQVEAGSSGGQPAEADISEKTRTEVAIALNELQNLPFEEELMDGLDETRRDPSWADTSDRGTPPQRKQGDPALLVIVIDDMGMSLKTVQQLAKLNYPVTMAFWPHGVHTREGAKFAHAEGREVLVHLPMEPVGYPQVKPGPDALFARMGTDEIVRKVKAGILAVPHAVGLNNHMGSRLTQNAAAVRAVLSELERWQFLMLDSVTHPNSVFYAEARRMGTPAFQRSVFLDARSSTKTPFEMLRQAENQAKRQGMAIAIGHPLPETLAALSAWQKKRDPSVRIVRLQELPVQHR